MFSNMLTPFLLAAAAILAAAIPVPQFTPPPADTRYYNLKAVVTQPYVNPTAHTDFNNSYLLSYHTGAGLNDVTFNSSSQWAAPGFLNGTLQQFNLSAQNAYIPWQMQIANAPYSTFSPVNINVGYPPPGSYPGAFYFNQTAGGSLWYNNAGNSTDPYYDADLNEFGGWLVCNWQHSDLPQLFALNSYYVGESPLPSNCVQVLLLPEYIN